MIKRLVTLVMAVLLLPTIWAIAEPVNIGNLCWQLFPFNDTIEIQVQQTFASVPSYTLRVQWEGATAQGMLVYALSGAGTAGLSFDGESYPMQSTLRNPSTFFNQQVTCTWHAAVLVSTFGGAWYATCQGPSNTAFAVNGTLIPMACAVDAIALGQSSSAMMTAIGLPHRLAGEESGQ